MIKRYIFISFCYIFCFSCTSKKYIVVEINPIPPNTVYINNGLYIDKNEVSNINYREYLFYLEHRYSDNTLYKMALPDTLVWAYYDTCFSTMVFDYLRTPEFNDYPAVGISYEQAMNYTKWRSDRVMEMFLATKNIIQPVPESKDDENFSIQKFFAKDYKKYVNADTISIYPEYSLPTMEEWETAIFFHEENAKNSSCNLLKNIRYASNDWCKAGINPMDVVHQEECRTNIKHLYHLKGNVCEWIEGGKMCAGGSWVNSLSDIQKSTFFSAKKPEVWVGFRNTCRWKKWERKNSTQ